MNAPGLMDQMFDGWKQYQQTMQTAQQLADSYFAAKRKLWSAWLSSLEDLVPAVAENWNASLSAAAKAWQGTVTRTVAGRTATLEESILEGTIAPESAKESRASRKAGNQKESSERAVA